MGPERLSPSRSKPPIPSKMSRPRFRTKKESHQTSNVLSSLVSSWKTVELFPTTTSRKSQPFIWFSDFVVETKKFLVEKNSTRRKKSVAIVKKNLTCHF